MSLKTYVSDLPELKINCRCADGKVRQVRFEGGRFETEDEEFQDAIERNSHFGSQVHWGDDPEELARKHQAENKAADLARKTSNRQRELQEKGERNKGVKKKGDEEADRQSRIAARNALKEQAKKDLAQQIGG